MSTCPFQVGDRIRGIAPSMLVISIDDRNPESFDDEWDFDPTQPPATVTAIVAEGFFYEYDTPVYMGRPFWGEITGGTCFPEGYGHWTKITS
jgi:hypothetical protein